MSEALPHADELRVRPEPKRSSAEDAFTDRELADGWANCFDLSRKSPRIRCFGRRMLDLERLRSETTSGYVGWLYDSRSPRG